MVSPFEAMSTAAALRRLLVELAPAELAAERPMPRPARSRPASSPSSLGLGLHGGHGSAWRPGDTRSARASPGRSHRGTPPPGAIGRWRDPPPLVADLAPPVQGDVGGDDHQAQDEEEVP